MTHSPAPIERADRSLERSARTCPACVGATDTTPYGEKNGYRWLRCAVCATLFIDREPTPEELKTVYETFYSDTNLTVPDFVARRIGEILAPMRRYRRTGRLLDVGYGAGYLLMEAEKQGWECWGQEVAGPSLRIGRDRGWHVVEGDLGEVDLPKAAFDVVCMTGVIEHVLDPANYVRRVAGLVRPEGLLYVTTPNALAVTGRVLGVTWSVFSAPEHVQLFSPSSLRGLLRREGFRTVRTVTEGINPTEVLAKLRSRGSVVAPQERVNSAYALNRTMLSGVFPRLARGAINRCLTATRLGEELKCHAERTS